MPSWAEEVLQNGENFRRGLREHTAHFFDTDLPLWRLSLSSTQPPLPLPGKQLIEWNGALRWLASDADAAAVRDGVSTAGGQATLFHTAGGARREVFHPIAPALMELHRRLKRAFDPNGIFNRRRIYAGV